MPKLLTFPNELLIIVGESLDREDLFSFCQTNRRLNALMIPLLYDTIDNHDDGLLFWAAQNGHELLARLVVEKGADINCVDLSYMDRNRGGKNPLHSAVIGGHESLVKFLLEKGAEPNNMDYNGRVPLHYAVCNPSGGNIVAMLLDGGADIAYRDYYENTPLLSAAMYGNKDVVEVLLQRGANIKENSQGRTVLHLAAMCGDNIAVRLALTRAEWGAGPWKNDEILAEYLLFMMAAIHSAKPNGYEAVVKMFLERDVDVSAKDHFGRLALHWAATGGNEDMVNLLLQAGSDTTVKDQTGKTALHWAVWHFHQLEAQGWGNEWRGASMRLLLESGVDVNVRDSREKTALHEAARSKNPACAKLLVEMGADINARDPSGQGALHLAASEGFVDMVRQLLELGADISSCDYSGKTALHLSIRDEATSRLLVEKGMDITARDINKDTPFLLTAIYGCERSMRLFLEKGTDVNIRASKGWTALHLAVRSGERDLVRILLRNGADITAKDKDGRTALHWAVRLQDTIIINALVGVSDIEARDNHGLTALHEAVLQESKENTTLLLRYGANINAQDNEGRTPLHHLAYLERLPGFFWAKELVMAKGGEGEKITSCWKR